MSLTNHGWRWSPSPAHISPAAIEAQVHAAAWIFPVYVDKSTLEESMSDDRMKSADGRPTWLTETISASLLLQNFFFSPESSLSRFCVHVIFCCIFVCFCIQRGKTYFFLTWYILKTLNFNFLVKWTDISEFIGVGRTSLMLWRKDTTMKDSAPGRMLQLELKSQKKKKKMKLMSKCLNMFLYQY